MKKYTFDSYRQYRRYKRAYNLSKYCNSLICMSWIFTFCIASSLVFILHEIIHRLITLCDSFVFYSAQFEDKDPVICWTLNQLENKPPRFIIKKDGKLDITDGIYFTGFFKNIRTFVVLNKGNVQLRALRCSCTTEDFLNCVRDVSKFKNKSD